MHTHFKYAQWLFFWLMVCLPLTVITAVANATSSLPLPSVQNFPSTEPEFETLRDAETIDSRSITALAQDAHGLIWIGTQHGLVRYDGYRFRKFTHKAGDPLSLAGDYVYSLFVAKDGRIWVGTNTDGISVFDPASERFENIRHDEKVKDSLSDDRIWALIGDGQGGMWIATDQGLDHLVNANERSSRRFIHFRNSLDPHSLMDNQVRSLLLDKAGRLWVGSRSGLQRLSQGGKRFETVVAGKEVRILFQAQDGKLWLGTSEHGAAWLGGAAGGVPSGGVPSGGAPSGGAPQQVHWLPLAQLSHAWIAGIAQVQSDQIWLATVGGGIIVVAANDGQVLQTLHHDPALPGSLAFDTLTPLLLDRAGWLWVGTWGEGLQRTNAKNTMLRILRHSPKRPNGLSHPDVRSLLELSDGRLLIGSSGNGIDIFDRQRGLVGAWRAGKVQGQGQGQGQIGALPDTVIYSLAQTGDGSVWAGTQQVGVVHQRPGSGTWEVVPGLPGKQVQALLASRDGSVWAGTNFGVARWLPPQPRSQTELSPQFKVRFEVFKDQGGKTMQANVLALAEDGQGRIWIGTYNGLWLHEPGHKGLIHIPADPKRPDGLVSDSITCLLVDSRGSLWVATEKGLLRLKSIDGKLARFEHVNVMFGQPDKGLGNNLLEDRQGRIWTDEVMIDIASMRMHRLTAADGIDIGTNWLGSFGKTRDGLLLFGGSKGVAVIDPTRFKAYDYAPPLVVTELKINGEAVAPQGLINPLGSPSPQAKAGSGASLTLEPTQRNFAIEFAALDYSDPKKNRYQYRLLGYDNNWIDTDAGHRIAAYGNLWRGHYTLQVRSSNPQGQFSPHELNIALHVLPVWWQSSWFFVGALLLSGSLLYVWFRWRVARLRAKARNLQKLIDARTSDILKLSKIGQELTATLDMEQALERVYQQVFARLDADVFAIGLVAGDLIEFVWLIEHGQRVPNSALSLDELDRPAVWCVRQRRELITHSRLELGNYLEKILPPISGQPMETVVYLPLLAGQQVIGCLSVQSPTPHAYNEDQIEFLRILASYTAIAMSNSVTHQGLSQSHKELTVALSHLQETQVRLIQAERQQISLDLHDNLSQTMTGVLLQLDTARTLFTQEQNQAAQTNRPKFSGLPYVERAMEMAREGHAQTRQLLNALRSAKKKQHKPINLLDTLRRDLPRLIMGTGIVVEVQQAGQVMPLNGEVELALFRIAQESVTNALRHGKAKKIVLLLTWGSHDVALSVQDDGIGFDPACKTVVPGMGLLGMQERVADLSGSFTMDAASGRGTCIRVVLPLFPD